MEEKISKSTLRGVVLWFGSVFILFKVIKTIVPMFLYNNESSVIDFIMYYGLWLLVSCGAVFILYKKLNSPAHPVSWEEYFKDRDVRRIAGLLIALIGAIELAYDLPMGIQFIFLFRSMWSFNHVVLLVTDLIQIFYGLYLFKSKKTKSKSNRNDSGESELA